MLPFPTEIGSFELRELFQAIHYILQYVIPYVIFAFGMLGVVIYGHDFNAATKDLEQAQQKMKDGVSPSVHNNYKDVADRARTKAVNAKAEVKFSLVVGFLGPTVFWVFGIWLLVLLVGLILVNICSGFYYGFRALFSPNLNAPKPADKAVADTNTDSV